MSKILRKIAMVLMLVMLTGLLTGCSAGSTVDTVLTINKDLSGSRVMTLVVDQSVYDEYFTGTVEQLNALIKEKCPKQLKWSYDDSTGVMIYTFILDFASVSDYKNKVNAIIGEGSDTQLVITKAESVWASGIYVKEDFTTGDLLYWLKTASVDAGYVSSSNSSKVFELGNHKLVFAGEEYSTNSTIYVDRLKYLSINSIDLLTDASQLDAYSKTIVMSIPEASMKANGDEIKKFLAAKVPTGATAEWSQSGTNSIYKVSKMGMTAEGMQVFLNEFFDTELCTVVQTDIVDNQSPFSFNIELVETVDFSNYLVGDVIKKTKINYYVKGLNGYVGGKRLEALAGYEEGEGTSKDYEGYRAATVQYDNVLLRNCTSYFQKIYRIKDIYVETTKDLVGGLERKLSFTLAGEPTEAEREAILNKINGLLPQEEQASTDSTESTETTTEEEKKVECKVDIKGESKDGNYTVNIKQYGGRESVQASSAALFGYAGDLYYAEKFGFASVNYPFAICDKFNFGDFTKYVTEDCTSAYKLDAGFGCEIEKTSNEGEGVIIKENTLTMNENVSHGVSLIVYGSQFNIWAVLFYVCVIVALASVVYVLNQMGVFKKIAVFIQEKSAASNAATPVVTTVDVKEIEEIPMFCENCGAKREADALVCTECGTRFEK